MFEFVLFVLATPKIRQIKSRTIHIGSLLRLAKAYGATGTVEDEILAMYNLKTNRVITKH